MRTPGVFFGGSLAKKTPGVLFSYFALTIVLTWPLARGLARDVPGDLGDSLLNMWILGWGAEHIPGLLTGALSWQQFWSANIFHPEPYTLTLSEHLFAESLQILPIYWLTDNLILCYNLLFLSTFVLSAMGMYLLARDLTGDWRAAFLAGLVYGFLPYRIAQIAHLQILSSQWMPFALYGLGRFVRLGSWRALAGGTAALVVQNWSCGYYLLYFAPFVPLCLIFQMWAGGRLRDRRVWIGLAGAAAVTIALSWPFLTPYMDAQLLFGFERPLGEVLFFSANVWSYVTASEGLHVWGPLLRFYARSEGVTFLGVVPMGLALVALGQLLSTTWRDTPETRLAGSRRALVAVLAVAATAQLVGFISIVLWGGFNVSVAGFAIRATSPGRLLAQVIVVTAAILVVSPRARAFGARLARAPVLLLLALTLLAAWLSLGPVPRTAGGDLPIGLSLYGWLYDYVPGFTGLRVPARYAMIAGLFLALLSGYGAAAVVRRPWGSRALAAAALLFLIEGAAMPIDINRTWGQREETPPARVLPAGGAPGVYARLSSMPTDTVVAEFPFGDPAWEIRYLYYSTVHWKPIVNGYSGALPPAYQRRLARLQRLAERPDEAWAVLRDAGVTHAIVHAPAFKDPLVAAQHHEWLEAHGARRVESFPEGDVLYALPR